LLKLGFSNADIRGSSTGVPKADRLKTQHIGPIVERVVGKLAESPQFQSLSYAMKREIIQRTLKEIRKGALKTVFLKDREAFMAVMKRREDPEIQAIIKELSTRASP